ncbi:GSCOCG00007259001-RA-CDS [Cotesia congregata]|nr:GSCOCG00007259001-RA-CDS [Cotesia congregata]
MKIIKYSNWVLVGLFFINIVDAVISDENNKEYESLTINERNSMKLPGLKRPFCNAFTGCGKKRNYIDSSYDTTAKNDVNDSTINIPLKLYQILMNNLNLKIQQVAKHKNYRDSINTNDEDYIYSPIHKEPIRKRYNF